jgi:hypothetical protein
MTITATFPNGFTDTYKGSRNVKAAWAIFNTATGAVIKSGHSLDRQKATKTADGSLQTIWFERDFGLEGHPLNYVKGSGPHMTSRQRTEARSHNAARLDFIRSQVTIQIVDL